MKILNKKLWFFILAWSFLLQLLAQNTSILIDGIFSDWDNTTPLHIDTPGDDDNSNIDFGRLWVSNDQDFLFIRIEVRKELNLQSNNQITLYLDTDNDASTGLNINGIGAEISYNLGQRNGQARLDGFTASIDHSDIGLVTAPTVTSEEFEIAINRKSSLYGIPFFSGQDIKISFEVETFSGDQIPDQGQFISYTLDELIMATPPAYSIKKNQEDHLRILSYNVLFDNLFEPGLQGAYDRIISAIAPEIIGFQEIYDFSASQTAAKVENFLPSDPNEQWYRAKIQPDIIAVSRYPILGSFLIQGASSNPQGNGAFLIDLNPTYNSQLLFIVAHTPCCDNEDERQRELDAIMAFVRNAKDGTGPLSLEPQTPIVIVGDMNMVGLRRQQQTLLTGDLFYQAIYGPDFDPDWDNTPLEDGIPYVTNQPLAITWYNPSSSFSPGRLDYIVYSGSVMDLKNIYSLFTPALPEDSLTHYNLFGQDVVFASDHLPVVADFELNLSSAVRVPGKQIIPLDIRPNPFQSNTQLSYQLETSTAVSIQFFDARGQLVRSWDVGQQVAGVHTFKLDRKGFSPGIYFCQVLTEKGVGFKKLVVH